MNAGSGVGPDGAPRAVELTCALPRLLDAGGLTATFFVAGVNRELNPQAMHVIAARGHERGVHGWRDEPWAGLAPAAEPDLLERATAGVWGRRAGAAGFRRRSGCWSTAATRISR